MSRRLYVRRRDDGVLLVHTHPDRPYWARPLLEHGVPVCSAACWPRYVTFEGDGFVLGQHEYTVGDLDPLSEQEQSAYERGLAARRRLSDAEIHRKSWPDSVLWAYQHGLRDRDKVKA